MLRSRLAMLVAGTVVISASLMASCGSFRPRGTWHAIQVPTDAEFDGIWFADSLNGWMTGGGQLVEGGLVGRTRDGGLTWQFQSGILPSSGTSFSLHRVQFTDTLHGSVAGDGGLVLRTDDGGQIWREVYRGRGSGDDLFDLQLLKGRFGWAVGPASIVTTLDGGQSWGAQLYSTSENGYLSPTAVHFIDDKHGWLTCRAGQLMRSQDGGNTWSPASLPPDSGDRPTLWDVTFSDSANGWVVGEQGSIFRTHDGGASWTKQQNGVPIVRVIPRGGSARPREVVPQLETEPDRLTLTAVRFADPIHGWAVGYYADVGESVVLSTGDGGATWRTERTEPSEYLRSLFVLDVRHAWAAGRRSRTAPQVVLRYTLGRNR